MRLTRGIQVAIVLGVLVAITGCRKARIEPPAVKVAVLNFQVGEEARKDAEIKGWWFHARDIIPNELVGEKFADALNNEIEKRCPFISTYSRMDFKYYMVSKKEILKRQFPSLGKDERKKILEELDPVDIGRDLGVDKVVAGNVLQCYTSHSRTFHWWSSVVEVDVKLIDVATGEVEWQFSERERKKFLSWLGTSEKVAEKVVKKMNRMHFYKP